MSKMPKINGLATHSFLLIAIIILVPIGITTLLGLHNGPMIALFISIVVLWFSELIPAPVTGLLVPCLAVIYGITDPKSAFSAFGNQILFLFIGAFLLGKAMQKHGWDKRIAYFILSSRAGAHSPNTLTFVIALVCWSLSMWISNTAACVIIVPIALGINNTLRDNFNCEQDFYNFSIRLLLTCTFASSIGGLATPVGTPPNLLAIQFLSEHGIDISFIEWMAIGLPVSLAMLATLLVILKIRYKVPFICLQEIRNRFENELKGLGKIKTAEIQVAVCFCLAIILWIAPGILAILWPESTSITVFIKRLPMGAVAIICALFLFCLPVRYPNNKQSRNLLWQDAKTIDWGTILLFGGGLCLGFLLNETGLAKEIGKQVFDTSSNNFILLGAITILLAILLSEFSSNTASTAIILPIVLAAFSSQGNEVVTQLVVAAAFGASYGFMLPVSTPPNAIVYGTGQVPLQQMIRTGVLFDISGFIIITFMVLWLLPLLGLF